MNPSSGNGFQSNAEITEAERTLHLIATLPAPHGLEERVKAGLQSAPSRTVVVAWPSLADGRGWMSSANVRAAAAAAIVLVVAGGGWGVYSHIQIAATPSAVVLPPMPAGAGGFSAAGATRKPQTLEGPVVAAPITTKQTTDLDHAAGVSRTHQPGSKAVARDRHAHAKPKSRSAQPER